MLANVGFLCCNIFRSYKKNRFKAKSFCIFTTVDRQQTNTQTFILWQARKKQKVEQKKYNINKNEIVSLTVHCSLRNADSKEMKLSMIGNTFV